MKDNHREIIAAFDFDGTITTKDTLFDFIIYVVGWPKFLLGLTVFFPTFLSYLFKQISNGVAKEVLLSIFFKNMPIEKFNSEAKKYSTKINQILNVSAIEKIEWHKAQQHQLIIVSASIENWILPWANENGFEKVIATKIEVNNGLLTGKFKSKNCNGSEKVSRFLEEFPQREEYRLYAYGDTNGDTELLKLADFPYFKKFQ